MFTKLLKHEWRATRGVVALLCVIILISGLTIGGVAHYVFLMDRDGPTVVLNEDEQAMYAEPTMSDFEEVVCILLMVAGVMAVAICAAASVFVVIWRFYKSRFTDEGYLTFTLPVNNHQLLLSSILNSIFGVLLVMLACIAAVGIAFVLVFLAFPQEIIWADVWVSIKETWLSLQESLQKNAGEFALTGIGGAVGALAALIELMLAVTIGALIAKKHKIIAAVAAYYGINMVVAIVQTMAMLTTTFSQNLSLLLGSTVLVSLVVAVGGYFLMHYLTSRKLNLT